MTKTWHLSLFLSRGAEGAERLIEQLTRVQKLLEDTHGGAVEVAVRDLDEHPDLASEYDLQAVPTLLRTLPEPLVRVIGDLSDEAKVVEALTGPLTAR